MLARREHTREELRNKLRRRIDDEAAIEAALDGLARERLQSDDRHAESYLRQRADRGYGPLRIARELRDRGTSKEAVSRAIDGLEEADWLRLARAARVKRFGRAVPAGPAERARQMRFLEYRGFQAETIRAAVGGADGE
ncbi:MAG: Regulatory protein RecX [Gammaproteobacteria bacterium]|nr:Regulatory protein RecX [Gammaproteobacteria bacterium]